MLLHPSVIALLVGSLLTGLLLIYSCGIGLRILLRWNLKSGSELQLRLERKTYLISTILTYAFGFELISLFLFIYTADSLHPLFVGAMCASGTLGANQFGYPALLLKIAGFLLAGLWLILNHADTRGYDYPLIRKKYLLLLLITPVVCAGAVLQGFYLLSLEPNVITSCCGSLFSAGTDSLSADLAALPSLPTKIAFYLGMGLTLASGLYFYLCGRCGFLFSLFGVGAFAISLAAIISFISLYYYELPSHHCPFDILQAGYGFVGYPLYLSLFGGAVPAMGVGLLMPFRNIQSLKGTIPDVQRRLALVTLVCFTVFVLLVSWQMVFSDFILGGY